MPIDALTATVVVTETHEQRERASIMRTEVRERSGDRLLARGANANFTGGRAKWVLGVWGTAGCPAPGSAAWSDHYHLARNTAAKRPTKVSYNLQFARRPRADGRTSRTLIQIDLSMAFSHRASPYRQR